MQSSVIIGANRSPIASSYAQKTVSSTAVTLAALSYTIPATADWVEIQIETNSVRATVDGSTPTASAGFKHVAALNDLLFLSKDEASALKLIRVASDAVINIQSYKAGPYA